MKIKTISILACLFFCMIVSPLRAQISGTVIHGQVQEAKSGDPLPFAIVYSPSLNAGCTCDENGNYSLKLNRHSKILVVKSLGYHNDTLQLKIPKDKGGPRNILWNPKLLEERFDNDLIIRDLSPTPIVPAPKRRARQADRRQH